MKEFPLEYVRKFPAEAINNQIIRHIEARFLHGDILNVGNKILIGGRSENTKHRTIIIIAAATIIIEQFFRFPPDGRDDVINLCGFLHGPGSLSAATSATKASSALRFCFWAHSEASFSR